MDAGNWIAVVAALVACVAAFFSYRSSQQSKRTADKALGDLPPFIHVYQDPETGKVGDAPVVVIQVVNHNRRPMHIVGFEVVTNDGYIAYQSTGDSRETIGHIISAVRDDPAEIAGQIQDALVPGNVSLSVPTPVEYRFVVTKNGDVMPSTTDVGVTLVYRLNGDAETTTFSTIVTAERRPEGDVRNLRRLTPSQPAE